VGFRANPNARISAFILTLSTSRGQPGFPLLLALLPADQAGAIADFVGRSIRAAKTRRERAREAPSAPEASSVILAASDLGGAADSGQREAAEEGLGWVGRLDRGGDAETARGFPSCL